jgi:hypothetical protein
MGFWFKQIFAGRRPVGDYICKDDIIFVASYGSWVKNRRLFHYVTL